MGIHSQFGLIVWLRWHSPAGRRFRPPWGQSSPFPAVRIHLLQSLALQGRHESLALIRFDQLHLPPSPSARHRYSWSLHDVAITPERYAVPECVAAMADVVEADSHALVRFTDRVALGHHQRQLWCTRSMENCPDSFVIVPAFLHDPPQFASRRASPWAVETACTCRKKTRSHARGMSLLRKAPALIRVIAWRCPAGGLLHGAAISSNCAKRARVCADSTVRSLDGPMRMDNQSMRSR